MLQATMLQVTRVIAWTLVGLCAIATLSAPIRNTDNLLQGSYWGVMNVVGTGIVGIASYLLARWCGRKLNLSPEPIDPYEILQVSRTASPQVIESAYRRLARVHHHDVGKTPSVAMKQIILSYEILKNSQIGDGSNLGDPNPSFLKKYFWFFGIAFVVIFMAALLYVEENRNSSTSTKSVSNNPSIAWKPKPIPLPTSTPRSRATPTPYTAPTPTPRPRATPTPLTNKTHNVTTTETGLLWDAVVVAVNEGSIGRNGFKTAWENFEMVATFPTFSNLINTNSGLGDIGFYFHSIDPGAMDVITLTNDGKWFHRVATNEGWDSISNGTFSTSSLGSPNALGLTVSGTEGKLYLNGTKIADIRVSSSPRGSGLGVVACTFFDTCNRPATVKVTNFGAWHLPTPMPTPIPTPTSTPDPARQSGSVDGELRYKHSQLDYGWVSEILDLNTAIGTERNLYIQGQRIAWYDIEVSATFGNPWEGSGPGAKAYDYGFKFRGSDYISLSNNGSWVYVHNGLNHSSGTFDETLLMRTRLSKNELKLSIKGTDATFWINGVEAIKTTISEYYTESGVGVVFCKILICDHRPAIIKVDNFKASPII